MPLIKARAMPIPSWALDLAILWGYIVALSDSLQFARTRESSLDRLEAFLPHANQYAALRNYVTPDHSHVSRLSPAIRHRLVTEFRGD